MAPATLVNPLVPAEHVAAAAAQPRQDPEASEFTRLDRVMVGAAPVTAAGGLAAILTHALVLPGATGGVVFMGVMFAGFHQVAAGLTLAGMWGERRSRRDAAVLSSYGTDLTITAADVAADRDAQLFLLGLARLIQRAEDLEAGTGGCGFTPGEVARAVRAEAWQVGTLLREASALTEQAQACRHERTARTARRTATQLLDTARTRTLDLGKTLDDVEAGTRVGAAGNVLSAVARARATLESVQAHRPTADLAVLARAASDALVALEPELAEPDRPRAPLVRQTMPELIARAASRVRANTRSGSLPQ